MALAKATAPTSPAMELVSVALRHLPIHPTAVPLRRGAPVVLAIAWASTCRAAQRALRAPRGARHARGARRAARCQATGAAGAPKEAKRELLLRCAGGNRGFVAREAEREEVGRGQSIEFFKC